MVFNAQADLSDLPNFDYVLFGSIRETDQGYEVTLRRPLDKTYPAGTTVRLHEYLDFPRAVGNPVPTDWTRYAVTIAAEPVPGARREDFFWPGAEYIRVRLIHQYTNYPKKLPKDEPPPELLFDDIVLKQVPLAPQGGKD